MQWKSTVFIVVDDMDKYTPMTFFFYCRLIHTFILGDFFIHAYSRFNPV